jgi:hypothetical protein
MAEPIHNSSLAEWNATAKRNGRLAAAIQDCCTQRIGTP